MRHLFFFEVLEIACQCHRLPATTLDLYEATVCYSNIQRRVSALFRDENIY